MTDLTLYKEYSRKEVQLILEPGANFTPGSGVWGLQGIINIRSKFEQFVFFVTYGRQQSGHIFEEGISKNGVLSWQSQPSQSLEERRVKRWINQKTNKCKIFLFVRNDKTKPYIFLGDIKYSSHDKVREKPVWFQFQVENWRYLSPMHPSINPQIKTKTSSPISKEINRDNSMNESVRYEIKSPKRAYFERSFILHWNVRTNQLIRKGEVLFSLVDAKGTIEIKATKNCRLKRQLLIAGSPILRSELPIAVLQNVYLDMTTATNKKNITPRDKSPVKIDQAPLVGKGDGAVNYVVKSPKRACGDFFFFDRFFTLQWTVNVNDLVRKDELLFYLFDADEVLEGRAPKNCQVLKQLLPEGSHILQSGLPIAVLQNVYLDMTTATNKKNIIPRDKSPVKIDQAPPVDKGDGATDRSVTTRLEELLDAHPEILGADDGMDLHFGFETNLGTKIPLLVHAPGQEKYVISLTDQEHDAETRKEVVRVIKLSVELAMELGKPLETNDIKKVLFLNKGTHPVTDELAKKYSVFLVKL